MKRLFLRSSWVIAVVLLCACSNHETQRQQAIKDSAAPFASHAITVTLRAEPNLNALNDIPNSCTILIIQAADKTALDSLQKSPVQLKSIFSGAGAEGKILQVDRYVVMPGQVNTLHIDRVENTRYVEMVAGYFPFPTEKHIVRFQVPISTHQEGWWNKVWLAELSPLDINVTLGSESIVSTQKPNADTAPSAQEDQ